jgi:hypothetical protein
VDLIFDPAGLRCVMLFWPQDRLQSPNLGATEKTQAVL